MRIVTIGSKIADDAIRLTKTKQVHNGKRITNISPFVLANNINNKMSFSIDDFNSTNEYIKEINLIEMKGCCDLDLYDMCVVDLLDMRMSFAEYILEDGEVMRMTRSNYNENIDKEKLFSKQIVSETWINPMQLSDEDLETEISEYVSYLTEHYHDIVLLNMVHPLQCIDINGTSVQMISDYVKKQEYNGFYDRCMDLFLKYFHGRIITCPRKVVFDPPLLGDSFWGYNLDFYKFLIDSLVNPDGIPERLKQYQYNLQQSIDKIVMPRLAKNIENECHNKTVVMIGESCYLEEYLQENYGVELVKENIDELCDTNIIEKLKMWSEKKNAVILLPHISYKDSALIDALRKSHMIPGKDYFLPQIEPYELHNYLGSFEDAYGNVFCVNKPTDIKVAGMGAYVEIAESIRNMRVNIISESAGYIAIGNNMFIQANGILNIESSMGSYITIGQNTSFNAGGFVYGGIYGKIIIGEDCMFATDVKIKNNVFTPSVIQIGAPNNNASKYEIHVGNHVWGGYQCCILSGAGIGDGSIIGARAVVENDFSNQVNCTLAGDPAFVVKKGRSWSRHVLETDKDKFPKFETK